MEIAGQGIVPFAGNTDIAADIFSQPTLLVGRQDLPGRIAAAIQSDDLADMLISVADAVQLLEFGLDGITISQVRHAPFAVSIPGSIIMLYGLRKE